MESARKQWQEEADEAQRLSKLSAEEREKAEFEIKLKKFEKDKADLDRQKLE